MMRYCRFALLAVALGTACLPVQAHYLWVERDGDRAMLHFGEYEEGAIERSPGRLDEIRAPVATVGPRDVPALRRPDGFLLELERTRPSAIIVRETSYSVRNWTSLGIGVVKPMFYARHAMSFEAAAPVLPLDIVPDGTPGRFRVWLDGRPLAKATVKIVAPNGWAQEDKTGEDGRVVLAMPWRGQYILQATHKSGQAGEFEGQRYEALRHRATLTINQPDGAETFRPNFGAKAE